MSPKKKAAIITSAAVAGLVAFGIVAFKDRVAGTPIIIKGSSEANQHVTLGSIPKVPDPTQTFPGEIYTLKVKASSWCMVYHYYDAANPDIHLITYPSVGVVNVVDKLGSKVDLTFDKTKFEYIAADEQYKSLAYYRITGFSVGSTLAKCTDKDNKEMPKCPEYFPNAEVPWLEKVEISFNDSETCP